MVMGMGAGLQARACYPCNIFPGPALASASASLSTPSSWLPAPKIDVSWRSIWAIGERRRYSLWNWGLSSREIGIVGETGAGLGVVHSRAVAKSSLVEPLAELGEGQEEWVEDGADLESITEWELDFCSRPILDSRGKKLWELVICDRQFRLRFARFYPNNVINSVTLRDALTSIMQNLGVPKPQKIRFFRSQMQTIISKACAELDIESIPSQRCITLIRWLQNRYDTVYCKHPGFQEGAGPLMLSEQPLPSDVPETLRGEQWAFVQLPLSSLLEEIETVKNGSTFGSVLDLDTLGINLPPDATIPGVAVASSRATPLAAWTSALELASIDIEPYRACLLLSSGVSDRWRYAFWPKSKESDLEAQAWEAAKADCGGLHFLAIQHSLDSELCTGFWLLMNQPRSPV